MRNIDRRPDSRIVRSALDEVKTIQTLLLDVYKDAGDGRTLLRELVQNADDARAERVVFAVLEQGWPEAENSLLHGPALLVVNDGPFPSKDRDALHQAMGGSKAGDADKVGRFGLGLKSLFHICEALVYVGVHEGVTYPGVLNPWAGTGNRGDEDPIHPDWDVVCDGDLDRLENLADQLLGGFKQGLFLWVPLRRHEHLDRAEGRAYGLGTTTPTPEDIVAWFGKQAPSALLLAQCRQLRRIEAVRIPSFDNIGQRDELARVERSSLTREGWVGRPKDDDPKPDHSFGGTIQGKDHAWSVAGVQALGLDSLRLLRSSSDWPQDVQLINGHAVWTPRKALAHAAITVLRSDERSSEQRGVRFRWAVFLPLDDDPNPRSNTIVEVVSTPGPTAWDIIMHGYFWPSHDRRSIPSVTDESMETGDKGDNVFRSRWNRILRDDLLLPLFPSALSKAIEGIHEDVARQFLGAITKSQIIDSHIHAITKRHTLLPSITDTGVHWIFWDSKKSFIACIPNWSKSPNEIKKPFFERSKKYNNINFIDGDAPRIGGHVVSWPADALKFLLDCISLKTLHAIDLLKWIHAFIRGALLPQDEGYIDRASVVANWIAKRIGDGSFSVTLDNIVHEDLRHLWREIIETLPVEWMVDVPIESHRAVSYLAEQNFFGAGLLVIPFGRRPEGKRASQPDAARLERALLKLGELLYVKDNVSQSTQRARLLLAEALLSVRSGPLLGSGLEQLPLLRAHQLPNERDEAWSVSTLCHWTEQSRVFARRNTAEVDESALGSLSDPKQAAMELAEAIGAEVWIVDGFVAAVAKAPTPTADALATAVLKTESVNQEAMKRAGLLRRLAPHAKTPDVQRAIRTLLTGQRFEPQEEPALYYVRSQDSKKEINRETLRILLVLLNKEQCVVEARLVEPLPHETVLALRIKEVDTGVLRNLLNECISINVDWSKLDQNEVIHLLQSLYTTEVSEQAPWRAMPLHRRLSGGRGCLDDQVLQAVGEMTLPPELEAEVQLLNPDPEVARFYSDVPKLDDEGILQKILKKENPHQFFQKIIKILKKDTGRIAIPRDEKLCSLLQNAAWLPLNNNISGIAPKNILFIPNSLYDQLVPLVTQGAFGEHRLPKDIVSTTWSTAEDIVKEIFEKPDLVHQIQHLTDALDTAKLAQIDDGSYLILPDAQQVSLALLKDALQTPLVSLPGWSIIKTVMNILKPENDQNLQNVFLNFSRSFCSFLSNHNKINIINTIIYSHPSKSSISFHVFQELLKYFSKTALFFDQILPHIQLPTQDKEWHSANEIARSESGVASKHLILPELRSTLIINFDKTIHTEFKTDFIPSKSTADALECYFRAWTDKLNHGAVGAFLSLLGNGNENAIINLAEGWLGSDVSIDGMRENLIQKENIEEIFDKIKIFLPQKIMREEKVEAINLLGNYVEMSAESNYNMIFSTDPVLKRYTNGYFWEFNFREINFQKYKEHELTALLGNSAEWWAVRVLHIDQHRVKEWWSKWGKGSQAQVGPVQASVLAHLPLTLYQLDVRESDELRRALSDAQLAQRQREQAPSEHQLDAMKKEQKKLEKLKNLIFNFKDHQYFLWSRVRELMKRYGYQNNSVLLELAQNADDALSQASEIANHPLPLEVRKLVVHVHDQDGTTIIDVKHYGRPINDTGGSAFPTGHNRQWDQDLYFMMLLNLSGKPGETLGQATAAATTGKFGLGFKSVHLISAEPSVVSGFIAFSIKGGLLPFEQSVPDDSDLSPIAGHRATRVRLPLKENSDLFILNIFNRFIYTCVLLPVFARQIREVIVDGGPHAGISAFDPQPLNRAPGWSLAKKPVEVPGQGQWHILRFRPADQTQNIDLGTTALAIGLKDGMPTPFPADMPFLWNVTPTSESWGWGYAINGPFKLDPGRTHVALDDDGTCRVVDLLGEALGRGLIELHDSLIGESHESQIGLLAKDSVPNFITTLWNVLTSGIETSDKLRRSILQRLHGPNRGLSAWMSAHSVVPSDLPKPFLERLPVLKANTLIKVAGNGFDDPNICQAFDKISDLALLASKNIIVSTKIANRLQFLLGYNFQPLHATDLLTELGVHWDHMLTPERLRTLHPLATDLVWRVAKDGGWYSKFAARAANGDRMFLRELLIPHTIHKNKIKSDINIADELLRSSFAPRRNVLDMDYIDQEKDLDIFIKLRRGHQINATKLASWYNSIVIDQRHAALLYLLRGELNYEVLHCLISLEDRPIWLANYDEVRGLLETLGEDRLLSQWLLSKLFPERFQHEPNPVELLLVSEAKKRNFFDNLGEWWNDSVVRRDVIASYEKEAWPEWLCNEGIEEGLRSDSPDHWLGLLVLGACRSIGRADAGHHRKFLELAKNQGWWDIFKNQNNDSDWMMVLRDWQDEATAKLTYPRWMSMFPAIYQLSRYLDEYKKILKSLMQRPTDLYRVTCLLSPLVDEALTGAGQSFDAPPAPLNIGLHWVLRELVRVGVIDGNHIYQDCWFPSDQLIRFIQPLGLKIIDSSNHEKSRSIFEFLKIELKTEYPTLHKSFDIPIIHIKSNKNLLQQFGLKEG